MMKVKLMTLIMLLCLSGMNTQTMIRKLGA